MGRWKNFSETFVAIQEVGRTMFAQVKSSQSGSGEPQRLELLLLPPLETHFQGTLLSSLTLTPSGYEYRERFPTIAVEVAKELFSNLYVLTMSHAFPSTRKQRSRFYPLYSCEEAFLHTYVDILQLHGLGNGIHYQSPGDIITETYGADIPLSTMLFSGDYGVGIDYHAYGFAAQPPAGDIVQARHSIDTVPHVLHMEYDCRPDTLEIHIDTERLPIVQCLAAIQNICTKQSIPLKVDSALKSQIL